MEAETQNQSGAVVESTNGVYEIEGEWVSPDVQAAMLGETVDMSKHVPEFIDTEEE